MNLSQLIEQYILSKQHAWAPQTLKTEASRLKAHVDKLNQEPADVFEVLSPTMKPYAIKTTFIRLGEFHQWLYPTKANPFKDFMRSHARLFKYVYESEKVALTYEQAHARILGIRNEQLRLAALQLLEGGLRCCELKTLKGNRVIGKGSKPREAFLSESLRAFRFQGTYAQLHYALKKVGLKPHTLRKLCATRLAAQEGITSVDLLKAFGWNNIETSKRYQQPIDDQALGAVFKRVRGEG